MPRSGYISVPVTSLMEAVFDDFVKAEGVKKTVALNDMLELYMLATNPQRYLALKQKHLNVEAVREMVLDRNLDLDEGELADTFLFMKLGTWTDGHKRTYNGDQTMKVYIENQKSRGFTWFGTESLYSGMAKRQVEYFRKLIREGKTVKILFAIGSDGGVNDVKYTAIVEEIESKPRPQPCPDPDACPKVWGSDGKARMWFKLRDLKEDTSISARDLIIRSTGRVVKDVISNSQFHFGYVKIR